MGLTPECVARQEHPAPDHPARDAAQANPPYDVFARACPSRGTLEHVTGRWGALVLGALYEGSLRFTQLSRRVDGVSEKMLSQTLHTLQRDGLVHREARPANPPRVDYELTPLGREVAERLLALIECVEGRMDEVLAARARHDAARGGR
ncbi:MULTISPECIES: winged helix-turn-helix transcriptional regulator [Streptomyces]|uniref:Helix-turn-helix transcriptional regulator n=1 Tax=Streptomyces thermoviolaceus subsp. thermoviolaceus TaxID=66860 RepID=A0ABX0YQ86_STRTL|nr:helix-turn-helix domain-containing protein [Streptomyces thermoviolaceus]NJP14223.1 helix-turn-helix transcriptional regulator [Streptomyces thermoviolaceus subsp. thermoviolaceus]WTD47259.1 helix-turn-helix transcriptional regulator [Streptomyces thermoviolaceus]